MATLRFEKLFARRVGDIRPGLERMRAAYDFLFGVKGFPIPVVLVAGTNGKGTTAGFLWEKACAAGLRAGLYTSPHLVHFCERFCVAGEQIDDDRCERVWKRLEGELPAELYEPLSFFEIATLIGLLLFRECGAELVILEVGLGGRWDATNVCEPVLSLITSIGLDHQEYLGHTQEAIAGEKAGVMRRSVTTLVGRVDPEAAEALELAAASRGAVLHRLPDADGTEGYLQHNRRLAEAGWRELEARFVLEGRPLGSKPPLQVKRPLSLLGRFQHGRCSQTGVSVLLDACHNPAGVTAFCEEVKRRYPKGDGTALVCIFSDKDFTTMLDGLARCFHKVILFRGEHARCFAQRDLAESHRHFAFFASFEQAWQSLDHDEERAKETPVVICGSLMTLGEVIGRFGSLDDECNFL